MRESGEREEDEQFVISDVGFERSGGNESGERAEDEREKYRMREAAMTEHRAAFDSERSGNDIGIGNHRADGGQCPKPRGNGFAENGFARRGGENGV